MKYYLCTIFLLFSFSLTALAQTNSALKPAEVRFFSGLRINTSSYNLYYNKSPLTGSVAPIPSLQLGYYITKRTSMQIGITYGRQKRNGGVEFRTPEGKLQEEFGFSKTKAVFFPLNFRYILSNPDKRLQLFGSVSFIPAYGTTDLKNTIKQDNIITSTNSTSASGLNAFITGGLGLNYVINKRFEANGEIIFLNENLKIVNISNTIRNLSLGVGINYNLLNESTER